MTDKTFTYAGVSTAPSGTAKVRFTNDLPTRIKIMTKHGHDDVDFRELPGPMTKPEAVAHLMTLTDFNGPIDRMAIEDANDKYNVVVVKRAKGKAKTKANAKSSVSAPDATKTAETTEA